MNIHDVYIELLRLSEDLDNYLNTHREDFFFAHLEKLQKTSEKVGLSWSQSWLGYHSCVYYNNLKPPPNGAVFSPQLGLNTYSLINPTRGEWIEYNYTDIIQHILNTSGSINLDELGKESKKMLDYFEGRKSDVISALSIIKQVITDNTFLNTQYDEISKITCYSKENLIKAMSPKGTFMSSDARAMTEGIRCPPHIAIIATVGSLECPYKSCENLSKYTKRASSHLKMLDKNETKKNGIGTRVFIGHGGSKLWRELKDFIQDRMYLPWDEFNRVPVAGIANITRLLEMLDNAAIAFLILTAEDEQNDGTFNPRMNVVHEAGLFQGRLGFSRAIILLEEGCNEFSNINGLGEIRFPSNNIRATFEDVRQILEREGLIDGA